MTTRLLSAVMWMGSLFATSILAGCGGDSAEHAGRTGTLQMALAGSSTSGVRYRLRGAIFDITGPSARTVSLDDNPDSEAIDVELQAGSYSIELRSGWFLERETPDYSFSPIKAVLMSVNPVTFTIEEQKRTKVQFQFRAGTDIFDTGNGGLSIGITVDDAMQDGGTCPPDRHLVSDGRCLPILFADDFSDGVIRPEWLLWRKTFSETGGRLVVGDQPRPGFEYGANGRDARLATHIGDPTWTDYRLDLDVEEAPPGSFNPFGLDDCTRLLMIEFRSQEAKESWNEPAETSYWIGIVPSPTACNGPPQQVNLGTIHNQYFPGTGCCTPAPGASNRNLLETVAPTLIDGVNHYAIEVRGNNIKFWANGASVFDYTDDVVPYAEGASPIAFGGFQIVWVWEMLGSVDNVVVTDMR